MSLIDVKSLFTFGKSKHAALVNTEQFTELTKKVECLETMVNELKAEASVMQSRMVSLDTLDNRLDKVMTATNALEGMVKEISTTLHQILAASIGGKNG